MSIRDLFDVDHLPQLSNRSFLTTFPVRVSSARRQRFVQSQFLESLSQNGFRADSFLLGLDEIRVIGCVRCRIGWRGTERNIWLFAFDLYSRTPIDLPA